MFEVYGIELEYMIVQRDSLQVMPAADRVLAAEAGAGASDVVFEDITWSNELVLHVIELKVSEPVRHIADASPAFRRHVNRVNDHLGKLGACLMPTAMHPTMDPRSEVRLWPHGNSEVYETFNRIFDCRGHGWANLQSIHLNLPFADDEEFGRLHAAVRLILPILPALAASSPIMDGVATGLLDNRLAVYRTNCARIPSITGLVIPEPVFSIAPYHEQILGPIYRDLAPHDPGGILREEWVNARGAIARFERNTIEIRLIDAQECPTADLAIAAAVTAVAQLLVTETWADLRSQRSWPAGALAEVLNGSIRDGEQTAIHDARYLREFGWTGPLPCSGASLWAHLVKEAGRKAPGAVEGFEQPLEAMLRRGTLASAILRATDRADSTEAIDDVYRRLCACLAADVIFQA